MKKKNTGKPSEGEFEDRLRALGKSAYFHRLTDAADVKGRTGVVGYQPKQPCDYLIVISGSMEFAEVKSTTHATAFAFSNLKPGQSAHATMILAAGGVYTVYIHSLLLNQWFRVPMQVIQAVRAAGKASIPWPLLADFKWV